MSFLGPRPLTKKAVFLAAPVAPRPPKAQPFNPPPLRGAAALRTPIGTDAGADYLLETLALGLMLAGSYESPAPEGAEWIEV